jgi:hypothetical protein
MLKGQFGWPVQSPEAIAIHGMEQCNEHAAIQYAYVSQHPIDLNKGLA